MSTIDTAAISARAQQMRPGHTAALLIGGFFWAIGWLVAKLFVVAWRGSAWMSAAVVMGWQDARNVPPEMRLRKRELAAQLAAIQAELKRRGGA